MLHTQGLHKTFNRGEVNEVRSLQGLDLTVAPGEFVVVLGGNGSGKSTFLNVLAGTYAPDEGSIRIDGRDVTRLPEHRRAAWIGRVFQNPFSGTAAGMTVAENLAIASRRGRGRGLGWPLAVRARQEMRDRLGVLGMDLENRLDTFVGTLSGGQRQALTLLMATWTRPKLLLLDEHTAALDPKAAEQVLRLTAEIVGREGLTTLMVTHAMQQAAGLGDRLIMLHRGRVVHDYAGEDKKRLGAEDLLARFEEIRRRDLLNESAAELLRGQYV